MKTSLRLKKQLFWRNMKSNRIFFVSFFLLLLANICPILNANAYSKENTADFIAVEIVKANKDTHQVGSLDCWIESIERLQRIHKHGLEKKNSFLFTSTNPSDRNTKSSPQPIYGADFCSNLTRNEEKMFALHLSHCHLQESHRKKLPETCITLIEQENHEMAKTKQKSFVEQNRQMPHSFERQIQYCLSDLSQEAFVVYSQFKLYTEQACIKLTDELMILRKKQVMEQFHETMSTMEQRVQHLLLLQDTLQKEIIAQSRNIGDALLVTDDIKLEMNLWKDQIESMSRTSQKHFQSLSHTMEAFDERFLGTVEVTLRNLIEAIDNVAGWYNIAIYARFIGIQLLMLSLYLYSWKYDCKTKLSTLPMILSIFEFICEYSVYRLFLTGIFNPDEMRFYVSILRSVDVPIYALYICAFFATRTWKTEASPPNLCDSSSVVKESPVETISEMHMMMQSIQEELRNEKKRAKHDTSEMKESLSSLEHQLRDYLPINVETRNIQTGQQSERKNSKANDNNEYMNQHSFQNATSIVTPTLKASSVGNSTILTTSNESIDKTSSLTPAKRFQMDTDTKEIEKKRMLEEVVMASNVAKRKKTSLA
ncbi:hypothetical protein CTEN210_17931 [Chaetoceros tenuissimus]|uniref:Uncharacterized protein n=1 Tax=Chaetoceros tenuissimus TaxID=426638 RepID=A0AAD3DDM1_9STRA|nr:hypothetical protein CTEN210_17931 [Chaetoceros tenuissimus]